MAVPFEYRIIPRSLLRDVPSEIGTPPDSPALAGLCKSLAESLGLAPGLSADVRAAFNSIRRNLLSLKPTQTGASILKKPRPFGSIRTASKYRFL